MTGLLSTLIPALALLCYVALWIFVVLRGQRNRATRYFVFYLLVMVLWSLGALMLRLDSPRAGLWWKLVSLTTSGFLLPLLAFVRVFLGMEQPRWLLRPVLGAYLLIVVPLSLQSGIATHVAGVSSGRVVYGFDRLVPLMSAFWMSTFLLILAYLIMGYRRTDDPVQRNRIRYLLLGLSVGFLGSLTNIVPKWGAYPLDNASNVVNAALITYAVVRYHLLDLTLVLRRGLAFSLITFVVSIIYLLSLVVVQVVFSATWLGTLLAVIVLAGITAAVAPGVLDAAQSAVDRGFFRKRYDTHRMVRELSDASLTLRPLDELASMLLTRLSEVMGIAQGAFLVRGDATGSFHLLAQVGYTPPLEPIQMQRDHPLVQCLSRRGQVMHRGEIRLVPQFKGLWVDEEVDLEGLQGEVFIGVPGATDLQGMIVLGPKRDRTPYSLDDESLLTTLVSQVAVAVENDRLYAESEQRARQLEALHAASQLTQFAVDHGADAAFWISPDARFTYVNEAACNSLGYSRQELLSMTLHDIDPTLSEEVWAQRWLELRTHRTLTVESHHRAKDGQFIPVEVTYNYVAFHGKEFNCAFARDITERVRAEKALRESERRLRLISENTTDVIFAYDLDRHLIYVNPAVKELTGYSVAELQERDFINWLHPEDEARMMKLWEGLLEGKGFSGQEFRIVTKDGQIKWCLSSWGPLYDESGRQIGVQGRERDITKRVRAEEALRESEEKYRYLVEQANDGITIIQDTVVQYANPRLLEMWGGTLEEVIGTSLTNFVHPDELLRVVEHYRRRMAGESVVPIYETTLRRKNGERVQVELSAGVITYRGKPADLVIVRDIAERKRAEQQVIQAERLATLGRLAAALAHEINNPLQIVQSYLDLLLDFPLEAGEDRQYLDIVRREIKRLSDVGHRVLSFAHPTSAPCQPVAVVELVQQVLVLAGKELQRNGIEVTTDWQDVPRVLAEPDQVTQIFLNLVINAVESMPDNGQLHVAVYSEGDQVAVSFTNSGSAIPREILPRIFEPFFTTKPGGNGLGLWISHSLVQQHGGSLTVENLENDQGVACIVKLPSAPLLDVEEGGTSHHVTG